MKTVIILLLLILGMLGCSTTYKAEGVNDAFPNSDIVFVPSHSNDFIVRDSNGAIWYVRCDNPFTKGITSKVIIFKRKIS
jgi:hypothetical protein